MIIGLSGYGGAGKDTLADMLVAAGWRHLKFAGPIKEMARAINPWVHAPGVGVPSRPGAMAGFHRYVDVIEALGDTDAKLRVPDVRDFQQKLGTDACRNFLGDDVWVRALLHQLHTDGPTVISDVRFVNEAQAVRDAGGVLVRIDRPGITAVNSHVSEDDLKGWAFDLVISNDGSPVKMFNTIKTYLESL